MHILPISKDAHFYIDFPPDKADLEPPGTEQQCGHPRCGEEAAHYFGPDLELGPATVTFSAQLRLEGEESFRCSDLPLSTSRDQSVASHGTITRTGACRVMAQTNFEWGILKS